MAYITLYRKWRPRTFAELVGQDHVARTLANAVKEDRVAHAYLFTGPRGTGKTSTAKILAKAVNCRKGPTAEPCGECPSCRRISDGSSLDVLEIDAASNRGIDEIRDLREKVNFIPGDGPKKVYIIDEVHMLTPEAFNALLKLLEEPPSHIIFVLATTEPHKVLPTIISRCQRFDFRPIAFTALTAHLKKVATAEKIEITDGAVELIAKEARGGLRDALGVLDQLASYSVDKITELEVRGLLGLIAGEKIDEFFQLLLSGESGRIFSFSDELVKAGYDLRRFLIEVVKYGRNLFIIQNGGPAELLNATTAETALLTERAAKISAERVRRLIDIFSQAQNEIKAGDDPQFAFEAAALRVMKPAAETTIASLAERLALLEASLKKTTAAKPVSSPEGQKKDVSAATVEKKAVKRAAKKVTKPNKPAKKPAPADADLRKVERFWPTVMAKIKQRSLSTHAVLMECRPTAVRGDELIIEAGTEWRRRILAESANDKIIAAEIKNVMKTALRPVYSAGEEGASPAAGKPDEEAPAAVEQGGRVEKAPAPEKEKDPSLLDLIQESLGAEIVEDVEDTPA